ncbi:MAG: HEPN domain-containing protein [Chloroflexi bacterium]|nr:HEPN domain-containing protein [Chloroflexota bacterium]
MVEIDIDKHVARWREDALSSLDDGRYLITGKRVELGLFSIHLALEKAIKAHVVKNTKELPPRIHNLLSLAALASLTLTPEQERLLAKLNTFNIRGRYSDVPMEKPTLAQAESIFKHAKEVFEWLVEQL